jgi:hypothetical protein
MINVTDRPHIHMRLCPLKLLLRHVDPPLHDWLR